MTSRSTRSIARLANFTLIVVIGLAAGYLAVRSLVPSAVGKRDVVVPDLRGSTESVALDELERHRLRGRVAGEVSDSIVVTGRVATQEPSPGTLLRRGTLVQIGISTGPAFTVVPDVRGRDIADARAAITQAGLVPGIIDTTRDTITIGRVVMTHPEPLAMARRGAVVTVTLSRGTASIAAPDVVGLTLAGATARLNDAGLNVGLVRRTAEGRAGTVQAQRPEPGTMLTRGSAVELTVTEATP